jgi:hypothetical protein
MLPSEHENHRICRPRQMVAALRTSAALALMLSAQLLEGPAHHSGGPAHFVNGLRCPSVRRFGGVKIFQVFSMQGDELTTAAAFSRVAFVHSLMRKFWRALSKNVRNLPRLGSASARRPPWSKRAKNCWGKSLASWTSWPLRRI